MKRYALMLSLVAALGCNWEVATVGGCIFVCEPSPAVRYAVSPDSVNLLLQDSLVATAWECPTGRCLMSVAAVNSDWTVRGASVVLADRPGFVTSVNGRDNVLVKATAPGESWIDAVAVTDSTKTDSLRVFVADSSSIVTVKLHLCCSGDSVAEIRIGADVIAYLADSAGRRFRGQPTTWSISDTTVLAFDWRPSKFGQASRRLVLKEPGTTYIRATFLAVRDSLRVTVMP